MAAEDRDMWPEIEATWRSRIRKVREEEDRGLIARYDAITKPLKDEIAEMLTRRVQLELELREVTKQCQGKQTELDCVDADLQETFRDIAVKRREEDDDGRAWFIQHRVDADSRNSQDRDHEMPPADSPPKTNGHAADSYSAEEAREMQQHIHQENHAAAAAVHTNASSNQQDAAPTFQADEHVTGALVLDPDGHLIGPVRRIQLDNHWTQHVMQLPMKRHVVVRRGRKFTLEQLESIYEPTDHKGAKWLSCMIQATGDVQEQECQTCRDGKGTWTECVIVGGDEFPRCANCEWNRQGCSGSSYAKQGHLGQTTQTDSVVPQQELAWRPKSRHSESEVLPEVLPDVRAPSGGFTPVNNVNTNRRKSADPVSTQPKRKSLPNKKRSGRKSMPAGTLKTEAEENVQSDGDLHMDGEEEEDDSSLVIDAGPEITKDILVLQHDGVVYTEPEIMRGVPVARIGPDHPYWEQDWKTVEDAIRPRLEMWEGKLKVILREQKNRFLANRQVNRGRTSMDFLQNGIIHPYQFVAKRWMTPGFVNYDTLFRFAQVLEELPKFGIDCTPLEWLRQRMHELYLEQGDQFNLARTVHDLYHDPKLKALRVKCGFGNIGRPSGIKTGAARRPTAATKGSKIKGEDDDSPAPAGEKKGKRKRRRQSLEDALQPRGVGKKPRLDQNGTPITQPAESFDDLDAADFEHDGYTTHDSYSKDGVMKIDWRVYQIKTAKRTTNPGHTQYWHWVNTAQEGTPNDDKVEQLFEHQVLRTVSPPGWGVYKEPLDFHLRLKELKMVEYASGCNKVVVHTLPIPGVEYRGNVLAAFKRVRTVKRFLSFLRKKNMTLIKTDQ